MWIIGDATSDPCRQWRRQVGVDAGACYQAGARATGRAGGTCLRSDRVGTSSSIPSDRATARCQANQATVPPATIDVSAVKNCMPCVGSIKDAMPAPAMRVPTIAERVQNPSGRTIRSVGRWWSREVSRLRVFIIFPVPSQGVAYSTVMVHLRTSRYAYALNESNHRLRSVSSDELMEVFPGMGNAPKLAGRRPRQPPCK